MNSRLPIFFLSFLSSPKCDTPRSFVGRTRRTYSLAQLTLFFSLFSFGLFCVSLFYGVFSTIVLVLCVLHDLVDLSPSLCHYLYHCIIRSTVFYFASLGKHFILERATAPRAIEAMCKERERIHWHYERGVTTSYLPTSPHKNILRK